MWKSAFKESFKFLFDNPVIFLVILGNYTLLFMFGPLIGVVAGWFISVLYLVGLHGSIENLWEDLKKFSRWALFVASVLYLIFFAEGVLTYLVFNYLIYGVKLSLQGLMLFAPLWAFLLAALLHGPYILLFSSQSFSEFKQNLKRLKEIYKSGWGFKTLLFLWFFMYLTLLAGVLKFLHFTVGLFSVIATFWLTYYTFLGVRFFKKNTLKEVQR